MRVASLLMILRSLMMKSGVGVRSTVKVAWLSASLAMLRPWRSVSTMLVSVMGSSSSAWASSLTVMGKRSSCPALPRSGLFCSDITTTV